ncbi:Aste57867_12401 [Aphanomyces stellatus]|uniref:glucan endo-1,3-beta-D-glucosidase n=1 Tax=Aphanomyces stellatus TaxID=120398 RepID=A0A485KVG4_9STRA|nr:hypothetical protein As57867_012355 [Aphanomyces stellatus]VFT89252.1 Aste57867_12401 [Aphanomyces stellatus]
MTFRLDDDDIQTRATSSIGKFKRLIATLLAVGSVVLLVGHASSTAAALATSIATGSGSSGAEVSVRYFDWTNNATTILSDFVKIKERFNAVRTGRSDIKLIDLAAQAGLHIHAGISIAGGQRDRDIDAIVDGLARHPNTIVSVSVYELIHGNSGSENHEGTQRRVLKHETSSPTMSSAQEAIQALQDAATAANVTASLPAIAIVLSDQDWLSIGDQGVPDAVDVIGVVIQPYDDAADASMSPIQYLTSRWNAIVQAFPNKKIVLAGTGWPTNGPIVKGHYPSFDTAQKFVADAMTWFSTGGGGDSPSLFAFEFVNSKRANFGLVDQAKQWKFDFTKPTKKSVPTYLAFANIDAKVVLGVNNALNQVTLLDWNGWTRDSKRTWVQRGNQYFSAATPPNSLGCMDVQVPVGSHKPLSQTPVSVSTCVSNDTQSWRYNVATKQLQHSAYKRNCLTVWPSNAYPTLSACAVAGSPQLPSQQFEKWSM